LIGREVGLLPDYHTWVSIGSSDRYRDDQETLAESRHSMNLSRGLM
jgi:hypothetical protein